MESYKRNKFIKLIRYSKYLPFIISVSFLAAFIIAIIKYTEFSESLQEKDEKSKVLDMLVSKKSQLEKSLYSRIFYTRGIAAYVSYNPEITSTDFQKLARETIKNDSVISTMSLSKNCIIGAIYPIKGHEAAIGLNLLEHPARKLIVENTIVTRKTFVAGPLELVEGGIAFISYTPIFTRTDTDSTHFWGVTDIVILKEQLFNEAGLTQKDSDYYFALKGEDGSGISGNCFWGDSTIFDKNPVTVNVSLPTGEWYFAALPVKGWDNNNNANSRFKSFLFINALIISILIWLLTNSMIKISNNELQLKALLGSMEDLIIEFNREGRYIKIVSSNEQLLIKPKKELTGKTLYEVFDSATADYFFNALTECFVTKKLVTIEYPLEINSTHYWFLARLSYISENTVIYVAHDITKRKKAEEELKKTANKLAELNITKDKFFSIIAHDLRSPLSGFLVLTKLMSEQLQSFTTEELQENSKLMQESANNLYELLENLLEWSRMKRGLIEFNPDVCILHYIVNVNIDIIRESARQKEIQLITTVQPDIEVNADIPMLNTIFRNLISNAVKFTPRGGKVEIGVVNNKSEGSKLTGGFLEIYIRDNGIGISSDSISKLFKIDQKISQPGTEGEPSTGLGLLLCKDFVEKHGGKIWVESEVGKGSTFYFRLPID